MMKNYGGGAAWNNKINKWRTHTKHNTWEMMAIIFIIFFDKSISLALSLSLAWRILRVREFFIRERNSCHALPCVCVLRDDIISYLFEQNAWPLSNKKHSPHPIKSPHLLPSTVKVLLIYCFKCLFYMTFIFFTCLQEVHSSPFFLVLVEGWGLSTALSNVTLQFPIQ